MGTFNDRCLFSVSDRGILSTGVETMPNIYLSFNIMKMVENSSFIYSPSLKHRITFLLQILPIAIHILAVSGCLSHEPLLNGQAPASFL